VLAEIESHFVISGLCFEHSVARFFGAARFGNDDSERGFEFVADARQSAVDAVRVGVVEERNAHFVATGPRQRVGYKLRAERASTDSNQQ
jgi:hypothetical protein